VFRSFASKNLCFVGRGKKKKVGVTFQGENGQKTAPSSHIPWKGKWGRKGNIGLRLGGEKRRDPGVAEKWGKRHLREGPFQDPWKGGTFFNRCKKTINTLDREFHMVFQCRKGRMQR